MNLNSILALVLITSSQVLAVQETIPAEPTSRCYLVHEGEFLWNKITLYQDEKPIESYRPHFNIREVDLLKSLPKDCKYLGRFSKNLYSSEDAYIYDNKIGDQVLASYSVPKFDLNKSVNQKFIPIYTDNKIKLIWGQALTGKYTNGCVGVKTEEDFQRCTDPNFSAAALLCKNIGARLPSLPEYQSLITDFEFQLLEEQPALTENGLAEMQKIIPDATGAFWTSSNSFSPGLAYFINFGSLPMAASSINFSPYVSTQRWYFAYQVRCVR